MNERIKELWVEGTVCTWPRPGKFTAGENHHQLEAFAKLIIQECGNYLMSDEFIGRSDLDWSIILNDHFGVK